MCVCVCVCVCVCLCTLQLRTVGMQQNVNFKAKLSWFK